MRRFSFNRRALLAQGVLATLLSTGCNEQTIRSQSPEDLDALESVKTPLVGDAAVPALLEPVRVEAVSMLSGLAGTGESPAPSSHRAEMLTEMQRRGVKEPNQFLASKNTALVLIRGHIRPGARKGDHFDIEVRVPNRSETTSLRGGWLMRSRLSDYRNL
ncbi:MAG: flagellar basal body P-ring protein FlgI, partial [Planctomycetales bacterium]